MCRRWRELPEADHRHGAGRLHRRRADARLVLRPHRRRRRRVLRRPGRADGHPRRRVLRPPVGDGPRGIAKEFLFLGERVDADARPAARAWSTGSCPAPTWRRPRWTSPAGSRTMPRLGLALTKKAVNQAEDLMGLRAGMDSVFGLHHVAHAHNAEVGADSLAGHDARSMRDAAAAAARRGSRSESQCHRDRRRPGAGPGARPRPRPGGRRRRRQRHRCRRRGRGPGGRGTPAAAPSRTPTTSPTGIGGRAARRRGRRRLRRPRRAGQQRRLRPRPDAGQHVRGRSGTPSCGSHLKGHFAPLRHAAAYWRERVKAGEPVAARIINTSSGAGLHGQRRAGQLRRGQGRHRRAHPGAAGRARPATASPSTRSPRPPAPA